MNTALLLGHFGTGNIFLIQKASIINDCMVKLRKGLITHESPNSKTCTLT